MTENITIKKKRMAENITIKNVKLDVPEGKVDFFYSRLPIDVDVNLHLRHQSIGSGATLVAEFINISCDQLIELLNDLRMAVD